MDREQEFNKRLAKEVGKYNDEIREILGNSEVGQCGGNCRGYGEQSPDDLCPECRQALEQNAADVFSVSPMMRLLGEAMDSRS